MSEAWNSDAQLPDFSALDINAFDEVLATALEKGVVKLEDIYADEGVSALDLLGADVVRAEHSAFEPWSLLSHLESVVSTDALRAAYEKNQPKIIEASQRLSQNQDLYRKLDDYVSTQDDGDDTSRRALTLSHKSMQRAGVGLDDATRETFNRLQMELAQLGQQYSNNVVDAIGAYERLLNEADMVGCPATLREQMWDADRDAYVLKLDYPIAIPFLKHSRRPDLRQALYQAYVTKAAQSPHDNTTLIAEILSKRQAFVSILGYDNYASYSIEPKMADAPADALRLLDNVYAKARPKAEEEIKELRVFAKRFSQKENLDFSGDLEPWDIAFFSERLREAEYNYTEEETKPYFPLASTVEGLFGIVKTIFDVTAEHDPSVKGWHDDVSFYWLVDMAGARVAGFYLDPYVRSGEKRPGAWMNDCRDKCETFGHVPIAYIVMNASRPTDDTPSLLTFSSVETLFHEFGHALQHMMTTISVPGVSGISGVEWDAVELPSQFMENWCTQWSMMATLGRHYKTGASMPKTLFDKICAAKNFQTGLALCRQIYFAKMDLMLHDGRSFEDGQAALAFQRQLADEMVVTPRHENDSFLCAFGHIFAGGYAAGYYSYLWAEVLSADAFSAFEEAGLDDDDAMRACGQRFRETVLSLGGSQPARDIFVAFRGRPPSVDALLRHRGVI